jgi:hypothetical protein
VCEGGQVVKGAAGRVPESRPGMVAIDIAGWAYQCLPAVTSTSSAVLALR